MQINKKSYCLGKLFEYFKEKGRIHDLLPEEDMRAYALRKFDLFVCKMKLAGDFGYGVSVKNSFSIRLLRDMEILK